MECPGEEGTHPVIIHSVATHINVNLIEVPAEFHGLKRRMVGQMPRSQLLGVVTGKVPSEVHLLGLGRRRVGRYTPEPDLCLAEDTKSDAASLPLAAGTVLAPISQRSAWIRSRRAPKSLLAVAIVGACVPPGSNAWATKPSFSVAAPHLSQPSCPTTSTSTTPAVFPPLPQRTATVPPVPPNTVPQSGITQELPGTDATQQLMPVVSALAAKVDNLTATVSALSYEFASFKNQQHIVCSGTFIVAPTPSPASGAQHGQGERAVCQHSLCDPLKKKDNAAGQCATAAAPTPRMDTPAKPVKGAI
ncbi:hypothetical protein E2C01_079362 [Portunus trituberculatus]|uniref:Uncharacterized protein n=1 Tax=Portunus trituberculatus TaxID=210409 RepID=A0A5B7IVF1_PORTR|nr:hypothetical protein [Portunus trituberculatus]